MARGENNHFLQFYNPTELRVASSMALGYLAVYLLSLQVLPAGTFLYPASAVFIAGLFFGGLRIWPAVLLVTMLGDSVAGIPLFSLAAHGVVETVQACLGAYLLRSARIDPLFRRYRDMFYLVITVLIVAGMGSLLHFSERVLEGAPQSLTLWGHMFTALLFCLLIETPFLLRWFAKPRFNRPVKEVLEIIAVMLLLCGIDYALFIQNVTSVLNIPLVYALFIPLFWISLRLRPRFTALALLITAAFAVYGIVLTHTTSLVALQRLLFQREAFLITLAIIFYFITSLEEDRRLNTNLMRSQLSVLENALSRISTESRAKNDFIAILAHELRNPLAPVVSGIDLLKLTAERSGDDLQTLDMMDERMQTVRRLLDDLLDVSRISEGKLSIKKEEVELQEVLKRAIISTAHHIKERHQVLAVQGERKSIKVAGDMLRLEQIFSNLLTNASKYSDPGDQITLSVHKTADEVRVTVRDEGIGIPEDQLMHIFTPFHQIGSGARTQKGLGIGLALVQSFVEVHDGTVTVSSDGPGKGSQFTVTLPLLAPTEQAPMRTPAKRVHSVHPRILIIEKNDTAAWSIGHPLEMSGYVVEYAYGGTQALEMFADTPFDAILLDFSLPDIDPFELARQLIQRGFSGTLIALTDYSTAQMTPEGKNAGFTHFLVKPVTFSTLKPLLP